jgi:hypothetical protein
MRTTSHSTRIAAVAALLLAVGCRRDPRAPRRLAAGIDNRGFVLDLAHDRVLFIEGVYPKKTYLCAAPLTPEGRGDAFRVPGYSLIGEPYSLADGDALVEARTSSESDDSPRAVLKVDFKNQKVTAAYELKGAAVAAFAQPAWSTAPVAVVRNAMELSLARLTEESNQSRIVLEAAEARSAVAIDPNNPAIAVAESGRSRGAVRLYDPVTGRAERALDVRAPSCLTSRGNGHWLVALESEDDGRATVVDFDGALNGALPLFSSAGAIESVVAGRRWLFAIALSTAAPPAGDSDWLRPRELHRVDLSGAEPALTSTWTKRQGALLGLDEPGNRLYYAVTDEDAPAVWSIDLSSDSLRAAASVIDSPHRVSWSLIFLGVIAVFMAGTIRALT